MIPANKATTQIQHLVDFRYPLSKNQFIWSSGPIIIFKVECNIKPSKHHIRHMRYFILLRSPFCCSLTHRTMCPSFPTQTGKNATPYRPIRPDVVSTAIAPSVGRSVSIMQWCTLQWLHTAQSTIRQMMYPADVTGVVPLAENGCFLHSKRKTSLASIFYYS